MDENSLGSAYQNALQVVLETWYFSLRLPYKDIQSVYEL